MTFRMQTDATARKVVGSTAGASLGAALSTILIWVVETQWLGDALPEAVQIATTTLVTALLAYVVGYNTRPGQADVVVLDPGAPVVVDGR
jgi:hypothetical protein